MENRNNLITFANNKIAHDDENNETMVGCLLAALCIGSGGARNNGNGLPAGRMDKGRRHPDASTGTGTV